MATDPLLPVPTGTPPPPGTLGTTRRRWGIRLLVVAAALMVVAAGIIGLLGLDSGTRWLLARVPGLQTEAVSGALLGGRFSAHRIAWEAGPQGPRLQIDALRIEGLHWHWLPRPTAWLDLRVERLQAQRIAWTSGPPAAPSAPPAPPTALDLPVGLAIDRLTVGEIAVDTLAPVRGLAAAVHLGADGGARHRIDGLVLDWDRAHVTGALAIGSAAPLPLQGTLRVAATQGPPFVATLAVDGPLAQLPARLTIEAPAEGTQPPARLDARGTVAPFSAWPLDRLELAMQDLDLAALLDGAPSTRLAGTATLRGAAADAPLEAELSLTNAAPGRWDEGRVPVRAAGLRLRGRLDARDRVDLQAFDLLLGSEKQPAGRWRGEAGWIADRLTLRSKVEALRPQRLDGRAPALLAGGTIDLDAQGLPSPDPSAAPAPGAQPAATISAALQGRLDARAGQPVRMTLRGSASAERIEIATLELRAGAANAALKATAERLAAGWRLRGGGTWSALDPKVWWPAGPRPGAAAWQQGRHRLDGRWQADATLPDAALRPGQPAAALVRQLRGEAELVLGASELAGVPLSGRMRWQGRGDAQLVANAEVAGNRLDLDATLGAQADGSADRATLALDASRLAALAPLWSLAPEAVAAWAPRRGTLSAQVRIDGRWPAVRTEGRAEIRDLALADLTLARATSRWTLATGDADAPLAAEAEVSDLARGEMRLDRLRLALAGTRAAHHLEIDASSPLRPPAWTDALLGSAGTGSQLQLRADGRWTGAAPATRGGSGSARKGTPAAGDATAAGDRWQIDIPLLRASARGLPDARPWLAASPLSLDLRFAADGSLASASAAPGRITLPAGALQFSTARWRRAEGADPTPRIDLQGELEPIEVAPLLAQLQPEMGWSGDLQIGGRFDVRSGERFQADVVFERRGGDLRITEALGTPQSLELTELRVALSARDGRWQFTEAFAGRQLGEMAGAQVLQTAPQRSWPAADAPLQGVVEMRVNNLGAWGAWVPPGWRLAGRVRTSGSFGGTFGAPQFTGEIEGSGIGVRNVLQGVALTDGDVRITLNGSDASIERFVLKAGDGTLELRGSATLGAAPEARVRIEARRFQVLGRIDRRIVASGEAALWLKPDSLRMDGNVTVDEGLIDFSHANAPSLDDDVVVIRDARAPPPEVAPIPAWLRDSAVALEVDLGSRLKLRGRGLATTLRGQLRVSTPGGRPQVVGTVRAEDGTYVAYRQNLAIDRGEIAFSGPVDNPRLDILAVRRDIDVKVGVAVTGTAQNPRIRLYSDPEMADFDKLSWLVLGRASEGLGRSDTALVQRAALALLAGEGQSPTDNLLNQIGLTDFSVSQNEEGTTRETVVSLGRQLSRRWYLGYERSVNATAGTWQLIYRAAQRFTLRAQSGEDTSLDVIWTWRW